MRVIAGAARGRRLKVPKRETRPSTDRLREALFSILAPRVSGAMVLDLFAGSGALGIEALSRGAASAVFVESQGEARGVIESNLAATKLTGGTVLGTDVFKSLGTLPGPFDLILADPPYATAGRDDLAAHLLTDSNLPKALAPDGLLVVEVESEREAPEAPDWSLLQRRAYGSSAILFYGRKEGT